MKTIIAIAVIAVILLIAGVVAILIWVDPREPFLEKMANLSVAFISVMACGLLIALIALVAVIAVLVSSINKLTNTKVSPLIDKISETTDTARGTVAYVGEGIVSPMVRLGALLAGLRGGITALFGPRKSK